MLMRRLHGSKVCTAVGRSATGITRGGWRRGVTALYSPCRGRSPRTCFETSPSPRLSAACHVCSATVLRSQLQVRPSGIEMQVADLKSRSNGFRRYTVSYSLCYSTGPASPVMPSPSPEHFWPHRRQSVPAAMPRHLPGVQPPSLPH